MLLTVIPQIRKTASVASRITSTGTTTTSLFDPCSIRNRFNMIILSIYTTKRKESFNNQINPVQFRFGVAAIFIKIVP